MFWYWKCCNNNNKLICKVPLGRNFEGTKQYYLAVLISVSLERRLNRDSFSLLIIILYKHSTYNAHSLQSEI